MGHESGKNVGMVERWGINRDERKIRIRESEYVEHRQKISNNKISKKKNL